MMTVIDRDQDSEPWAPPRRIVRELPRAEYVAAGSLVESPRAALNEHRVAYHWRERRHRSPIYLTTLIRLREVGWEKGEQKEILMSESKTRRKKQPPRKEENLAPPKTKSGELVREARLKLGLTQPQAAQLAGYSKSGFISVELGTRIPQPRKIAGIAKGLDIDFQTLCDAVDEDRKTLDRYLGTAGHKTYYPAPTEPGEVNKRVVMDYLIDDMDFDRKKVAEVVEKKDEYSQEDIRRYIDTLLTM